MYIKEEGIFDHPALTNEPAPETSTDNSGKSTNTAYWIIVIGLIIVGCAVGYYVFKHYFSKSEEKKRSSTMYTD